MCKCINCNSRKSCDLYQDRKLYGYLSKEEKEIEKIEEKK